MTITQEYRDLNAQLHKDRPDYGARGAIWADRVVHVASRMECLTAIDYGCGKASLAAKLRRVSPMKVTNYDPAIAEYSALPEPADLVICTDVMEHIEPALLADVMEHIQSLANKGVFFNIACRPAKKTLADGRNAHLIVREPYFWLDMVREYFDVELFETAPGMVTIVARRLGTLWK